MFYVPNFPCMKSFDSKYECTEEGWLFTVSIESDNIASDTQGEWNVINLTQQNTASFFAQGAYVTVIGYD